MPALRRDLQWALAQDLVGSQMDLHFQKDPGHQKDLDLLFHTDPDLHMDLVLCVDLGSLQGKDFEFQMHMDPDYRMDFVFLLDFDVHMDLALCRDSGFHKALGAPFRMGRYFHKGPDFLADLDVCMDPVLLPLVWESCLGHCHPVLFRRQESPVLAGGCTLGARRGLEHILRRKALGSLVGTCEVQLLSSQWLPCHSMFVRTCTPPVL